MWFKDANWRDTLTCIPNANCNVGKGAIFTKSAAINMQPEINESGLCFLKPIVEHIRHVYLFPRY